MQCGYTTGAWLMAKSDIAAYEQLSNNLGDVNFYQDKRVSVEYYLTKILPRAHSHALSITRSNDGVMGIDSERL